MDFKTLRQANYDRQQQWPGASAADIPFRVIEVAGETGELAEAMKKYLRAQRGIKGSVVEISAVEDELADVIIAVDLLSMDLGVDLGEVVSRKFNKTSDKYGLDVKL